MGLGVEAGFCTLGTAFEGAIYSSERGIRVVTQPTSNVVRGYGVCSGMGDRSGDFTVG